MKGGLRTWGLKVNENKELWGYLALNEISKRTLEKTDMKNNLTVTRI
jgi:hypothetical protein